MFTAFAWRVLLGLFTGLGVVSTTTLYIVDQPLLAVAAAALTGLVGLLLARSFYRSRDRAVRQYTRVAERSLGQRRQ
jgi:hypothetical protein